jgi:hypothetical protein
MAYISLAKEQRRYQVEPSVLRLRLVGTSTLRAATSTECKTGSTGPCRQ